MKSNAKSVKTNNKFRPQGGQGPRHKSTGARTQEKKAPFKRTQTSAKFERKSTLAPRETNTTRPVSTKRRGYEREKSELFIWGRRVVENYLLKLVEKSSEMSDPATYSLHIIVDKTKKAPKQLSNAYEAAKSLGIPTYSHESTEDKWPLFQSDDLNHQRICLRIPAYPVADMTAAHEHLEKLVTDHTKGCVGVVLDQIQDPRNFGSILRSCAFFGVKFVIFGEDRQAGITPTALKASAGGAFSVDLIPVININRALEELKKSGAWLVGSTVSPEATPISQLKKDRPFVLVLGNEEKGLRQEVQRKCDFHVSIPGGNAGVDSLNVGVAAGVFLSLLS